MPRLSLRADAGVGAIAVSPTSRDAVLAGRSGLYIVDLQDPYSLPRWLPLRSVWEVASVQWCPHSQRPACLVSSSNQKVLVWNLALPSDRAVEHVLHGHRRAVTDIHYSPHHPDYVATASIDTSIKIWDLRRPGEATMTFTDFNAGAIQTRWSPSDDHQIASAHDNRIVLWDKRKANLPVASIKAHRGECNGLQFLADGRIITCSTDRTVKLWNMQTTGGDEPPVPETTIEAGFPVWRAIPTPFELGALIVPLRGGDNNVSVVNLARQEGTKKIADVQVGGIDSAFHHPDSVNSALFMRNDESPSHYDIVTWCHDSHLREWSGAILQDLPHASSAAGCKDDEPAPLVGNERSFNTDDFDNLSSPIANSQGIFDLPIMNRKRKDEAHAIGHLDWIAGVRLDDKKKHEEDEHGRRGGVSFNNREGSSLAEQLSQEIISVSSRFSKVSFDEINIGAGVCNFSLMGPWGPDNKVIKLQVHVQIPEEYPNQPMQHNVIQNDDMRDGVATEISEKLTEDATKLSRHGVRALEFSVRYLVGDQVSVEDYLASEFTFIDKFGEHQGSAESENLDADADGEEDEDDDNDYDVEGDEGDDDDNDVDDDDDDVADDFIVFSDDDDDDLSPTEIDGRKGKRDSTSKHGRAYGDIDDRANEVLADDIIDSTPVPRNCGAVWSNTGKLVCFFNRKPAGKEKGPLPLDKVFAEDAQSDKSGDPFISDSDDFEQELPKSSLLNAANWSVAATLITSNLRPVNNGANTGASGSKNINLLSGTTTSSKIGSARGRSRTLTSFTDDDLSVVSPRQQSTVPSAATHSVVIKDMLHHWPCRPDVAAEYEVCIAGDPLRAVENNARVAAKYGLYSDENIWRLLETYIRIEESECMDTYASMTSEKYKFDWCGGSTGLRSFMPEIASNLEKAGKVQMLACMSLIFSSLRVKRSYLRELQKYRVPTSAPLTLLEPNVESLFQIQSNGSLRFVHDMEDDGGGDDGDRFVDNDSVYDGGVHFYANRMEEPPVGPSGSSSPSTAVHGDASWYNSDYHNTDDIDPLSTHANRRHSLVPSDSHSPKTKEGIYIGVKISGEMFNHDHHPLTNVALRNESSAERDFIEWLPRLIRWRKQYASLLEVWGFNIKRAEIVKLNPFDTLVLSKRHEINKNRRDERLDIEVPPNTSCALCNMPITRLFEYCEQCSHALHKECAQIWWEHEHECPAACGCDCKSHVVS